MSFSIPKNVPSFTSPNREFEDVEGAVGGLFGANRDLPLYKDKPYYQRSGRNQRKRKMYRRKRYLGGLIAVLVLFYWFGYFSGTGTSILPIKKKTQDTVNWEDRREKVKEAFVLSWNAYEKHAWGNDQFFPVAKAGRQMIPKGMGWIIVDALDTMMIMNLTKPLEKAQHWVEHSLTFEQDSEVNTFETTIRMLGGLLSAHYLSQDLKLVPVKKAAEDMYLNKATDLADRLLGAYDSPSGVPFASVNLKSREGVPSHADGGASSTAEAATLQLEMKYLSKLIGETIYWKKAEKDGLVPIFVYADTGKFRGNEIRLGSRGDSYYEYLIKQYLQTKNQEPIYLDMYNAAISGVKKHLIAKSHPSHLTFIAELPNGIGGDLSPKMDHLVCFMPGLLALGATEGLTVEEARKAEKGVKWGIRQEEDLKLARELMRTCYEIYNVTATGLAPEIAWFNLKHGKSDDGEFLEEDPKKDIIVKPRDAHNLQRPETVESLFVMWRITGDEIYREWGWKIFEAFLEHTAVGEDAKDGFTSLDNVNEIPPKQRDNMESFWLAETLKYLYLLFSPNDILPLDEVVFNTEAHPFPKFEMGRLFETGWKRLPRDKDGGIIKEGPKEEEKKPENQKKEKDGK
ncbi:Glycoside Hydrolase Family 47 protein [Tuber magnatum]|uniref:alpha-1,2-Mannosidase n=1 Tax=Tuber magnatum TaxID=42249 RepID=A0A317SRU9_9PEZI|nr:Glycoside Hydrolase Family 47 protein [Tuber magnatum]